jgi:hypothetical protein
MAILSLSAALYLLMKNPKLGKVLGDAINLGVEEKDFCRVK